MKTWLAMAMFLAGICAWGRNPSAASTANDDVSGMYAFLHEGESLQLNLDHGRVSGFVTTFGWLESDKDTLLDRFFDKASLQGDQVHITTKPVHGSWLEFTGTIERGDGKTRAQEGYYRLVGTLTQYTTDEEKNLTAQERAVDLKSFPDEAFAGSESK
jgi:hypothetical protein